jgi:hypothetical protein
MVGPFNSKRRHPPPEIRNGAELTSGASEGDLMCNHLCQCPNADASDRDAALIVAEHHDQGWVLLCNGVVLFEDTGELLPDGKAVAPHALAAAG